MVTGRKFPARAGLRRSSGTATTPAPMPALRRKRRREVEWLVDMDCIARVNPVGAIVTHLAPEGHRRRVPRTLVLLHLFGCIFITGAAVKHAAPADGAGARRSHRD